MKPSTTFLAILGASIALVQLGFSLPRAVSSEESCLTGHVWAAVHYSINARNDSRTTCVHGSLCNTSVSATDAMRIKFAVSCCAQDRCIPTVPPLPEEDSKFDGLKCDTCRTGPYGLCKNKGLVDLTDCETIKEPCLRFESLELGYNMGFHSASDCAKKTTGDNHSNDTSVRRADEPFRQCIKISCNKTSAADTASKSGSTTSPTGRSTSLQNSLLLTVICLLLLEAGL
ncbi:uncharacterized protein [Hyperolius riggenbachi]|uniref:uncharacterized protein n=1 Tax=Hyperolius riggenbachi TaxID=752182 RepID=UPI0035A38A9D